MENIPLPSKISIEAGQRENESIISIQPCSPGFGTTLGNALRRVLLSSLPGAAVTAFKVKGVNHEFSSINNVKEDLVEISLNLKQLRLKVFSDEPVRLTLKAKGEKEIKAKDISPNSDVEIASKNLTIATLTGKNADLEMELLVNQGRGYVPTETREKENIETDMIMIDSIFTPVKNVGFKIENVRVGQMTNYENLTLTIQTDGTISPEEALKSANQILIQHFNFIDQDVKSEEKPKKTRKEKGKEEEGEEKEEDKEEKIKAEDKKEEKEKKKAERKAKKEKKAEAEEKKETEE